MAPKTWHILVTSNSFFCQDKFDEMTNWRRLVPISHNCSRVSLKPIEALENWKMNIFISIFLFRVWIRAGSGSRVFEFGVGSSNTKRAQALFGHSNFPFRSKLFVNFSGFLKFKILSGFVDPKKLAEWLKWFWEVLIFLLSASTLGA